MRVGDVSLTHNEDIWSKTVRDAVLVSAYPLASWLVASWWRLIYEPLPQVGRIPSLDWLMAHELGAADSGYVWPHVVFASDGEAIQVWAIPSPPGSKQSVRYLSGLSAPRAIGIADFESTIDTFVVNVLRRLDALGCRDTDLAKLWELVCADRADSEATRIRRIEAQLGYDPEECPTAVLREARELETKVGVPAWAELAPVYGRKETGTALNEIPRLAGKSGLQGRPLDFPKQVAGSLEGVQLPWQRAVSSARHLRKYLGNQGNVIDDETLYGALGLSSNVVKEWAPLDRQEVSLAVPALNSTLKYLPRKRHPNAKRFEFARFLGDHIGYSESTSHWLTSTDLATSRQKYQRAFAAEFLCPIGALTEFLEGDFSEAALEEAGTHFGVSDQTVESLLANNGYITPGLYIEGLPYSV